MYVGIASGFVVIHSTIRFKFPSKLVTVSMCLCCLHRSLFSLIQAHKLQRLRVTAKSQFH
jgi:hypothetical protein